MIVIIGHARTGTSVIFEALRRAGFNGGPNLYGHKYKTEDSVLKDIFMYLVIKKIDPNLLVNDIKYFWSYYCKENNIEIIKYPRLWVMLPIFTQLCPEMGGFKYIWTRRNKREIAKSFVRKWYIRDKNLNDFPGGQLKVQHIEKQVDDHLKLMRDFISSVNPNILTLHHEEIMGNPEGEFARLSDFVGRYVNPDIISREETWRGSGKVN